MLTIRDLVYRVAGRTLIDGASAFLPAGHKVGLVGRNGTGKSTLLRLVSGELQPDAGAIELANVGGRPARIGIVQQEAPSGATTPHAFVLAADTERAELLARAEHERDPARVAEIHTRLADIRAHAAPARAAAILAGLGFAEADQHRPLSDFSGGWRMRAALASVLFAEPDLLLLDEPTNHLDLETTLWLEGHLRAFPNTMLLVSHDRDLLNRAVDGILHLEARKLTLYAGGYDRFERTRAERLAQQEALKARQDAYRKHVQVFVDRFRYKASKARQVQSRLKALARLEPISLVTDEASTVFRLPEPETLAPPIVAMHGASVGYGDAPPVLKGLTLRIDPDDRIGLLGRNGNGKTTFARLVAGRLAAGAGEVTRAGKLRVGFFAQHQIEELDAEATAAEHMRRLMPDAPPDRVRARLGGVGLVQDKQVVAAKNLSGGEKARLTLALVMHDRPHLLILDEPTNHLDIDAREALTQALADFPGAVILISHDPHLMRLTADRLWLVADGTVKPFDGDIDDYRDWLAETARAESRAQRDAASEKPRESRKDQRRAAAQARAETASLRQAVREAEKRMERLAAEKADLEKRLADPETYNGPTARFQELALKKAKLDARLAEAETAWLAAEEALAEAAAG